MIDTSNDQFVAAYDVHNTTGDFMGLFNHLSAAERMASPTPEGLHFFRFHPLEINEIYNSIGAQDIYIGNTLAQLTCFSELHTILKKSRGRGLSAAIIPDGLSAARSCFTAFTDGIKKIDPAIKTVALTAGDNIHLIRRKADGTVWMHDSLDVLIDSRADAPGLYIRTPAGIQRLEREAFLPACELESYGLPERPTALALGRLALKKLLGIPLDQGIGLTREALRPYAQVSELGRSLHKLAQEARNVAKHSVKQGAGTNQLSSAPCLQIP